LLACLRGTGMPLAETETFTRLVHAGEDNVPERIELLENHRERLAQKRRQLDQYEKHLDGKIAYYNSVLEDQKNRG